MQTKQFDIIIVGGGMVGAGLALSLKDTRLTIAVIDARVPTNDDPRLFALNISTCQFLDNLGIWQSLKKNSSPIEKVHVSNKGHFGAVRLSPEEADLPVLGYVVPAKYVETELNACLLTNENVTLYRPARLTHLEQDEHGATLTLSSDDEDVQIASKIVIGADGTGSTVRKLVDIPVDVVNYQQAAIVTRVTLAKSHQQVAYERFNKHGAIAMLPLLENECACIWSADADTASRLNELNDQAFLGELQENFGGRLGRLQGIKRRHLFPLQMIRAERTLDNHVLLLGNSAHTLHPIAAQGFNLAMYEVATLVEGLIAALSEGIVLNTQLLYDILEPTRKQQTVSVKVSHHLSQLFASTSLPKNILLSLGMLGFDAISPVKKTFIKMMTGRNGSVPALLMRHDQQ